MPQDLLSQSAIVIITGAGGGYGCELAKCFASHLANNSLLVLSSKNELKLQKTVKEVESIVTERQIKTKEVVCDMNSRDAVGNILEKCFQDIDCSYYTTAILVNNASTVGDVNLHVDEYNDYDMVSNYMTLNVTNFLLLTTKFLGIFLSNNILCCVINVSSLCALQPMLGCGLYCASKAARDMLFKVLAAEKKDVRVLSWAPGPMRTDMTRHLENSSEEETASIFKEMLKNNSYIPCATSAKKLIMLLKKNEFASGDHIDYYDV